MLNIQPSSFEKLLIEQSNILISCKASDFLDVWSTIALDALNLFNIDRATLFPNSIISRQSDNVISVARDGVPPLINQRFAVGNYSDYFKLLKTDSKWLSFNNQELKKSKHSVLNNLYQENVCCHYIIPLQLFGQQWGALSFSCFNNHDKNFDPADFKSLKLLSELWLCYWQHSILALNLQKDKTQIVTEADKVFLLSKKQRKILNLLAQGYTAKQSAEKLHLSPRTIESHKYRMLNILNFKTHTEIVQFALRNDLGDLECE